ncbi:MAG TPA: hypothetical protein VHU42_10555, partial [Rhodopila sp.]|nr:hypothetical protein [Rhodopila sp.]
MLVRLGQSRPTALVATAGRRWRRTAKTRYHRRRFLECGLMARWSFRIPIDIHAGKLNDYALTALLVLESLILFIAAPLAGMNIRMPLFFGVVLFMPLIVAIVIISSNTGARVLVTLSAALAAVGAAFRINHPSLVTVWL